MIRLLLFLLGTVIFLIVLTLYVSSQVFWYRRLRDWLARRWPGTRRAIWVGLSLVVLLYLNNWIFLIPLRRLRGTPDLSVPWLAFASGLWMLPSLVAFLWLKGVALFGRLGRAQFGRVGFGARRTVSVPAGDPPNPARREWLLTAGRAAAVLPFAAIGYGFAANRIRFTVESVPVPVANLPAALEGLKLVQLTDIHLSPFLSRAELARAVDMANELDADVALVTGDFITALGDPLEDCIAELGRLRSRLGSFGCLGNHEIYADAEDRATELAAERNIRMLRGQNVVLERNGARLNLAGVDYQRRNRPYLVGARKLIVPGATNVLLSHNPDVFPVAAEKGFDLMISGHTHGGQIAVEILHYGVFPSRFYTPYVRGLYRLGGRSGYVSRGIGTILAPSRLGALPEITLLTLRRS